MECSLFIVPCYDFMHKQTFPFLYKNRKTLFPIELNSKRRLVVLDVGFENGGISLGFLYLVVRLD